MFFLGLDDEVKIWTPTSQDRVEKSYIEKAVIKNADKSRDGLHGQSIISGQMLWGILRQMRRNERRQRRVCKCKLAANK